MATLSLRQQANVTITSGGEVKNLGSVIDSKSITVTEIRDETVALADTTTWDVWNSADPVDSFDFLWIECASAIWVELTTDKDADVGTEVYTVKTSAGVPFIMTADDSFANYTADFAAGTTDVIDRIRIRNDSGAAVSVRFVIAT